MSGPKLILHKEGVKQASVSSNFVQGPSNVAIINWEGADMDVCEKEIIRDGWKSCCFVVVYFLTVPAVISGTRHFIDCRSFNWLPVICLAMIFFWICVLIPTAGWLARLGWWQIDLSVGVLFQKWRKVSSSLPPQTQNSIRSHPSSSPMGTERFLPWSKAVEALRQPFNSI